MRVTAATDHRLPIVASMVVAALAFSYRYTSLNGFTNDDFLHLARTQAVLAGDWPIRDYTEEGLPLTVLVSAGAQLMFGESLFAEAMLVMTSLAVAAGVTCWLTSRVTGSLGLGVGAALLQVLVYPRSYAHPKMLLYALFLLIAWWYLEAPSRRRLVALAVWTAVSFLMRHDHGVYIGLGSAAAIAVAHWRTGVAPIVRRGMEYGVLTLVCLAPYLAYVQYQQGIVEYFRIGIAISGSEAARTRIGRLTFDPLPAGSWVVLRPVDPMTFPGFRVRWKPDVDDRHRRAVETELGLLAPEHAEGRTWTYRIEPPGHSTLSRLVSRSEVEDSSGFDRTSLIIADDRSLAARAASALRLDRLERIDAGPRLLGLLNPHNVSVVLFFMLWSLPFIAIALVVRTGHGIATPKLSLTIVLSVLAAVSAAGLLRDSLAERIADVYGSAPTLLACILAIAWTLRPPSRLARVSTRVGAIVLASVFVVGTMVLGHVLIRVDQARMLEGPRAMFERAQEVFHQTREWPWPNQWPAGNGWKLARYVHDCTRPDDRLLVTWFAPEMNVFSRRVFAGGETSLLRIFRQPSTYEAYVLARLSRQSVPIVLVDPDGLQAFEEIYPEIGEHLDERYQKIGQFSPEDRPIDVYADRTRERTGTYAEFGWPCFVSR